MSRLLLLVAASLVLSAPAGAATCGQSGPASGGSGGVGVPANHYAQKVSLTADARVTALRYYPLAGASGVSLALYTDLAGAPDRRIVTSVTQSVTANVWNSIALDDQPELAAGNYWVEVGGLTQHGTTASPSLGAVWGPNAAAPGHPDQFGPVGGSYGGIGLALDDCEEATLAAALDNSDLIFRISAPPPGPWSDLPFLTHDGVDAAYMNLSNGQESSINTSVDGPGELRFWWYCSTGGDDSRFIFNVDGAFVAYISQSPGWAQRTQAIAAGRHELQWRLIGQDPGTHTGVLDQVEWIPASPTPTPSQTGTPSATATASPSPSPTGTVTPCGITYRVNAGGPLYTDGSGNDWAADRVWNGSGFGHEGGGPGAVAVPIAGTTDDTLYQTEINTGFTFRFDEPAGTYAVELRFAEIGFNCDNCRVFNVAMEGVPAFSAWTSTPWWAATRPWC